MKVLDDQMLDMIQIIHDAPGGGPRDAYAYFLGRRDFVNDTKDLVTEDVEEFIAAFYAQYNRRFGTRY